VGAAIATVVSRTWANTDEQAQANASTGQVPCLLKPRIPTTFLFPGIEAQGSAGAAMGRACCMNYSR
jgi:hypothetical protein